MTKFKILFVNNWSLLEPLYNGEDSPTKKCQEKSLKDIREEKMKESLEILKEILKESRRNILILEKVAEGFLGKINKGIPSKINNLWNNFGGNA